MAEIWEVVIWVIFSIVLCLIIVGIIASIYVCLRRRKKNARRKRIKWKSGDEIDYGSKKVKYNVQRGNIEILDKTDGGGVSEESTHEKAEEYGARKKQGTSSDKSEIKNEKSILEESEKGNDEKKIHSAKEISLTSENTRHFTQVQDNAIASTRRERRQPAKLVPVKSTGRSSTANNYTNLGYSGQQSQVNSHQAPIVRFHQPAAVVRAFVHPGTTRKFGKTKSLPRSYSRLSHKKTSTLSSTRRPTTYHWSLEAESPNTCPSWVTVPIRLKTRDSTTKRGITPEGEHSELEWDSDYKRWKFRRSLREKDTRRNLLRQSLRKQRERRLASPRWSAPVYITNTPVKASTPENVHHSSKHQYQTDEKPSPLKTKPPYSSVVPSSTVTDHQQQSHFSEKSYKMVKRSAFPGTPPRKDIEPDMASITSSEFSDLATRTPPRPSDKVSNGDESSHSNTTDDSSDGEYTRGSYKEYNRRIQSSENTMSGSGEVNERSEDDRRRHSEAFHGTLENLKNTSERKNESFERKKSSGQAMGSFWSSNDEIFRRQHGIPDTGVPVLPHQPIRVRPREETDVSDDTIR